MNKTLKIILLILVVAVIGLGSFAGGFVTGHLMPFANLPGLQNPTTFTSPTTSPDQQSATPEELQTLFAPFWEAWTLVHENYVDQPVDDIALMRGAITGMMQALGDEHSSYMDPQNYKDANASLDGSYEGIGAYVDTTTVFLTIISPIPGSPAERAGLLPGDQVVAIDGEDMTGITAEAARLRVLGPAGTTVRLTILRKGEADLIEFDITREKITVASSSGKMLENDIAYIQVTTFGTNTTPELLATLDELMAKNPKGIILDLRYNGGGFLSTSVEVASQFIGEGVVLYEEYGNGTRTTYEVIPGGLATDVNIPMAVLINEGSASASEIVAGALQDLGRAKLVGVVSYGKGSVQNWVPLSGDNGAVRITIAKWLTPNEKTINKVGLTPDYEVEITAEDIEAKRDPQLDMAMEFLSSSIAGIPYVYEAPSIASTESVPAETTATEPVPTQPVSSIVECPLAMPAHLISGESATVTSYLYLRSSPGIANNWIRIMKPNSQVEVTGNPTCVLHGSGAYIWWQVKLPDGTTGWLAE
ncbi:partial carboxyl-terminal processing protease, partial [Anaerolineae bacterium]